MHAFVVAMIVEFIHCRSIYWHDSLPHARASVMNPDKKFYWELPCSKVIDNREINTVPVSGESHGRNERLGDRGL